MPVVSTAIAAASFALAAGGTYMAYKGQQAQAKGQQEAIGLQQQADAQRRQAMELDARRRQRELVRQSIASRSVALTAATNQGASGGSALPGAYGGIEGRENTGATGIEQNRQIGENIFGLNMGISDAYRRAAAGGSYAAMGAGLSSLGNSIVKNAGAIERVGTYFGSGFGNSNSNSFGSMRPSDL